MMGLAGLGHFSEMGRAKRALGWPFTKPPSIVCHSDTVCASSSITPSPSTVASIHVP